MRALLVVVAGFLVGLALVVACGGGARATHSNVQRGPAYGSGGNDAAPSADAGVAFTAAGPIACPPSYADLRGSCDPKIANRGCSYPEGSCWCGVAMPCSGVAPDPAVIAAIPPTWQCTPTPPAVRADGCPGVQPSTSACTNEGLVCSWGDCCFTQMTCTKGTWEMTGGGCPP